MCQTGKQLACQLSCSQKEERGALASLSIDFLLSPRLRLGLMLASQRRREHKSIGLFASFFSTHFYSPTPSSRCAFTFSHSHLLSLSRHLLFLPSPPLLFHTETATIAPSLSARFDLPVLARRKSATLEVVVLLLLLLQLKPQAIGNNSEAQQTRQNSNGRQPTVQVYVDVSQTWRDTRFASPYFLLTLHIRHSRCSLELNMAKKSTYDRPSA